MAGKKFVLLAVVSLCSLSPFLMGQGCGVSAPVDNNNPTGGSSTPSTLYDKVLAGPVSNVTFWPTATGRTINVSITSSNAKSNLALGLQANTTGGGVRIYYMGTEKMGPTINVSFTSEFALMHWMSAQDYGQSLFGGTMTTQESQDVRYTVKVTQQ